MIKRLLLIATLTTSLLSYSNGQTLEELEAELAALEMELDSFSIFSLIDSVLTLDTEEYSELNIGFGYSSEVVTAGRTLGVDQHGFNTALSYFHKSGAFLNYSGYINSAYVPQYYLHNFSAGYFGNFSPKWSFSGSFQKQFYTDTLSSPLTNSLNVSTSFIHKKLSVGLSYGYYFGEETAQQVSPSASLFLIKPNFWFLKSISFFPTAMFMFGNPNLIYAGFDENFIKENWLNEVLTDREFFIFNTLDVPRRVAEEYYDSSRISIYEALIQDLQFQRNNNFGLVSTNLSVPIILEFSENFNVMLSYTYVIPEVIVLGNLGSFEGGIMAIGEEYDEFQARLDRWTNSENKMVAFDDLEDTSYFSVNLTYSIPFKKNK